MNATGQIRPLICILDGSLDVTGALVAARREAAVLKDSARVMLVLPTASRVRDSELPEFERIERLPIFPLRKSLRHVLGYAPRLLIAGKRLARLLNETGCTRLQVNDYYLSQAWVARKLGFTGTIATWLRIDPTRFGPAGRLWMKAAQDCSDHLVAVSHFVRSRIPVTRTHLIYDPVPEFATLPPSAASQVFVFIGNYIAGKGQDLAIAAFQRIAETFPAAELRFHGGTMGLEKNEAYLDRLKESAAAGPGGSRISFLAIEDPARALQNAVAALNCSFSETFSLACQEASALGRAVIATRSGGPAEIIDDGQTGYLVDNGDVDAIADRMARLLRDPGLAAKMGSRGTALVRERFPPAHFRNAVLSLFDIKPPKPNPQI